MATIPRAALDLVSEQVNALSADAQARVLRVLESISWTPDNISECREIVLRAIASVMPTYTNAAAQAGADLYDAVRAEAVGEAMGATAISGYEPDATEAAVRAFVQDIVDGKPVEQFNRKVLDRVDRDIRVAENVSVAENAALDPLEPRYARVPTGPETCEWCIMLASRGFDFKSERSAVGNYKKKSRTGAASHGHPGCDCRIVQGYPGMEVEGYDPDAYYELWRRFKNLKNEQVPVAQRDAILAAMRVRLMPDASASPTELAGLYQAGMRSAWVDFTNMGRTADAYRATVGAYISDVGDALGVSLSGSCEENERGRLIFARPDGFEMWAARFVADREGSVTFLPSDRSMRPDVRTESGFAEIKTPASVRKVASRLSHASEQLAAVGDEGGSVYLSLVRMSGDDVSSASETAARFVRDGTIRNLFTISAGGEVRRLQ